MKDLQIKKLYYSISEVSKMVGLEQYVLRYWETEFEQLRPQKNRAGNRIYTEKDIEIIKLIKRLTRENKFTNEGARQVMGSMSFENGVPVLPPNFGEEEGGEGLVSREAGTSEAAPGDDARIRDLRSVKATLEELLKKLDPSRLK